MLKFKYFKPKSIKEALDLKVSIDKSLFVCGGTDVFVLLKKNVIFPTALISLKNISELKGIFESNEKIIIKAGTTLTEIQNSQVIKKYFPALFDAVINMASPQIRNVGTIGGNICNSSPAADTASPLLIYDAKVKIIDNNLQEKEVFLRDFFIGVKKNVLSNNEILREFILAKPQTNTGSAYYKFMKRKAMDLANVGVAVLLNINKDKIINNVKIALSTVAPTPMRAIKTEKFLKNKKYSEKLLEEAGEIAKKECSPIDDIRGEEWHKREIVKGYIKRVGILAYKRITKNWG